MAHSWLECFSKGFSCFEKHFIFLADINEFKLNEFTFAKFVDRASDRGFWDTKQSREFCGANGFGLIAVRLIDPFFDSIQRGQFRGWGGGKGERVCEEGGDRFRDTGYRDLWEDIAGGEFDGDVIAVRGQNSTAAEGICVDVPFRDLVFHRTLDAVPKPFWDTDGDVDCFHVRGLHLQ